MDSQRAKYTGLGESGRHHIRFSLTRIQPHFVMLINNQMTMGMKAMRKRWKVILIIVVALVLIVIGLGQCGKSAMKKIAQSATAQTYKVGRGEIVSQVEITGEVQPETVVAIKSKVSGKIVKFYADENDVVSMGQIIADIEPDYNQANTLFSTKAQLSKAELRLENARKDLADKKIRLAQDYI